MSLCENETRFKEERSHPRLLKLVTAEIVELATAMGFSSERIETRDFRAERNGNHIVRIIN